MLRWLSDSIEDGVIQTTLNALASNLAYAAQMQVKMADEHDGKDNISVILVRANKSFECKRPCFGALVIGDLIDLLK